MKTNAQSFIEIINAASGDPVKLASLEKSLVRLWDAGIFTHKEFERLDSKILNSYPGKP